MNRPAATPPAGTADLREAIARAICVARGTNPDCQHEGPARDGKIDGRWDRTPTANCSSGRVPWHYGWRNHAHVADAILAGPLATLAAENEALRERNEALTDVLTGFVRWSESYPQAIFPEPDFAETHRILQQHGRTLDAVSAAIMRSAVEQIGARARTALTQGGSDAA